MPLTPRRDSQESRQFWDFVEQTAREVREEQPSWARESEHRRSPNNATPTRQSQPRSERQTRQT
jgi:hypothetical protein